MSICEEERKGKGIDPSEEFDTIVKKMYEPIINVRNNLINISSDILEYIKKRRIEKPGDPVNDHFFNSFEKVIASTELVGEVFSDIEKIMRNDLEEIRKEAGNKAVTE